jgi:type IV pilus assembly protein PilA
MLARIRKSQDEREGGFTLIELLVVIIIIGILAAIAIPVFLNQRKKAVDASIKSDLRTAATALETYFTDNQSYNAVTGQTPKFSQGNLIQVAVTTTGYCLRGSNSNSDAVAASSKWFYYDSTAGGLQSGAPTATSTSVGSAGATCLAAGTYNTVT